MNARTVLGLLGACLATSVAADSFAMPSAVMQIGGGNEGRTDGEMRQRGPGFEQTSMVNVVKDGVSYVVLITMQSFKEDQLSPWQCSCASYQLNASGPPTQVTPLTRLTNLPGGRPCNHPKAATDGENIVWMFGSDSNANRPKAYAGAIDHMCNQIVAPIVVSENANQNEGAPDVVYNGVDGTGAQVYTGAYLSTGGDNDVTYALGLSLQKNGVLYALNKTWLQPVVTPANIGRPTMASGGADRTLLCASTGHNRPQEIGITCSWMNSHDGTSLWKDLVLKADPQNMKYMGQPSLAKLEDGRYVLNSIESNGGGKNTNLKGSNLAHLHALDVVSDAVVLGGEITGAATYQTHSAVCTGAYGTAGNPTTAVISASPTGIGRPGMIMVGYDASQKTFAYDAVKDSWPIAWYGDSGHLANWYGYTPGRQGRDFLRCIGDVMNPGHGVDGGYMSNVETFFVAAVAGRVPGDQKNSLTLSLVPGKVDIDATPENPQPADQVNTLPAPPPTDNAGGSTSETKGCACSTPGTQTRGDLLGGLALLGMAVGAVFARRRAR